MAKKKKYPELTALKGRIREKKTSYKQLAADLRIGPNTLSAKINGFYAISGPEMEQLATSLDIEPRDITRFFMPTYHKTG